jgi:hypothetical protein
VGVYISPGETFQHIARRPDFLAPLVTLIVVSVAVSETIVWKIGMERIIRISIEQSGRASSMSAEQMQQAIQQGAGIGKILAHAAGFLGPPIYLLIMTGLGLLILNLILSVPAAFKTVFSVVCYAYLVGVLGALMALALILFGDLERFNPENFVPSNVGFFLNRQEVSKPLYALASSVDIFTVWFLILVAIGLSAATGRKARSLSIFLAYAGVWAIWILGKMGWAALVG